MFSYDKGVIAGEWFWVDMVSSLERLKRMNREGPELIQRYVSSHCHLYKFIGRVVSSIGTFLLTLISGIKIKIHVPMLVLRLLVVQLPGCGVRWVAPRDVRLFLLAVQADRADQHRPRVLPHLRL
jgi:hypothetical protein